MSSAELATSLQKLKRSRFDPDAWEELYLIVWPWLLATVRWRLRGDFATAEDISQEVFLTLLRRAQDLDRIFEDPALFLGYLKRLSIQRIIDAFRKQHVKPGQFIDWAALEPISAPEIDPILLLEMEKAELKLSKDELSLLNYIRGGLTAEEIAGQLRLSIPTTYNKISRLRRLMRTFTGRTKTLLPE